MAETGGTSSFSNEINNNINLGDSKLIIRGSGIGGSPGSVTFTLPVSATHPYLTFTTMLAPSPDWFTGVHGHNLMPSGNWVENEVVTLYAYDAGTDSGTTYTSSNSDTSPQELISRIEISPFFVNGKVVPIGELVINKIE